MKADIEKLLKYAWTFMGTPYRWGGDDPIKGADCSGFAQEVLKSQGLDPKGDQTAQALYEYFKDFLPHCPPKRGCILFFGTSKSAITHTALAEDERYMIEAGGGGARTLTLEDAARDNAFIRVRPIRYDLVASFDLSLLDSP